MNEISSLQMHGIRETPDRKADAVTAPIKDGSIDHRSAILRLVMYFDVFRHPLTQLELTRFIDPDHPDEVLSCLELLLADGTLSRKEAFIYRPGMHETIPQRQTRARSAEKIWPRARTSAAWLYRIPQVRGLMVTGSLSKNSTQPKDDIDFLVLVEPGQVWTLKTLLQGLRKVLPEPVRECFCTNYLLDISCPVVDQKNMFTAVELATAMPMAGRESILRLLQANRDWVKAYVPGFDWSIERASKLRPDSDSSLHLPSSSWLEKRAMSLWSHYWDRKYHWLDEDTRLQRFKRRPGVATNHLHDYQDYVLNEVSRRLAPLGLELPSVDEST
jgi:predicted nucleotidyltransferase